MRFWLILLMICLPSVYSAGAEETSKKSESSDQSATSGDKAKEEKKEFESLSLPEQFEIARKNAMLGSIKVLKQVADKGYAPAQALLGEYLDRAEEDALAVEYLRKAADQGDKDGQFGLGKMYQSGEGVDKNQAQALMWFFRAAEQGHAGAIKVVAMAYIKEDKAIDEKNNTQERALYWIGKAAEIDFIPALEALVGAYRNGNKFGVQADASKADELAAKLSKLLPQPKEKKRKRQ